MASVAIKLGKAFPFPFIMALLAGAAVALSAFLVPAGLIEAAVVASGLPSLLAAAAPPLGMTARALLAIGGGALAMIVTAGGLALADCAGRALPRRDRPEPLMPEEFAPRRRMLAIADEEAPRRPIFAGSDLGAPLGGELIDATVVVDPARDAYELVDPIAEEEEIELLDLEPIAEVMWSDPPAMTAKVEPFGDAAIEVSADEPEFVEFAPSRPVVPAIADPVRRTSDYSALTLSELLSRLEQGLERKRLALASAAPPVHRPRTIPAAPAISDMDEALRDALGTLRRMTARS